MKYSRYFPFNEKFVIPINKTEKWEGVAVYLDGVKILQYSWETPICVYTGDTLSIDFNNISSPFSLSKALVRLYTTIAYEEKLPWCKHGF